MRAKVNKAKTIMNARVCQNCLAIFVAFGLLVDKSFGTFE